jgi:hypothetical protein
MKVIQAQNDNEDIPYRAGSFWHLFPERNTIPVTTAAKKRTAITEKSITAVFCCRCIPLSCVFSCFILR